LLNSSLNQLTNQFVRPSKCSREKWNSWSSVKGSKLQYLLL